MKKIFKNNSDSEYLNFSQIIIHNNPDKLKSQL